MDGTSHRTDEHSGSSSMQVVATDGIAGARRLAVDVAAAALGRARASDVELVASELIANALEHGGQPPVDVVIAVFDESLTVEVVSDSGPSSSDVPERSQQWPAANEARGRGLEIAAALSDDLGITRLASGRVSVSARFDRA